MKQNMKRWSWFLLLGAVLVALDQWTKQLAVQYLMGHDQIPILPKVLYLLYIENRGAAFGSFQGAQLFFYVITVVVLCGLLYVVKRIPVKTPHFYPLLLVCELIFAGAIGNFIDRVVADIYVTTGCFLMVLLFLFYYKDEELHFLYHEKH